MNELMQGLWNSGPEVSAREVGLRLVASLISGFLVALVYRATRRDDGSSHLPATLVLLAILIAGVTQVIGDNVARAFSLVGTLSIVRFRTVVRDTRDTAFVIFAVVVGMAVGAGRLVVALECLVAVGLAAWLLGTGRPMLGGARPEFDLVLRSAIGLDVEVLARDVFRSHVVSKETIAVSTAKQGTALEYTYRVRLSARSRPEDLVRDLHKIEDLDNVELRGVEL
ncbi:MAG: DUF4956 domain-containing protein [Verrucomicrobiales bacterium]|nr:DUF4956 domain-containing protein [Verrucomicrobiales bacterium]